jgi:hypothetical protein
VEQQTRNIHYDVIERKENIDHNRNYGQPQIYTSHQQQQIIATTYQKPSNVLTRPVTARMENQPNKLNNEQSLDSFRPHSNKPSVTQSLENKDWKSVIDTVQINRNSSQNNLNIVGHKNLDSGKLPLTDKILSPEEIKAMLGKRTIHREEPRNYAGAHRIEVVRHTETANQPSAFLGRDVELKQSYFDQPPFQTIDQQHHRISSFSPEFNQYHNINVSNNMPPATKNSDPDTRVFKSIEGQPLSGRQGTYADIYNQNEIQSYKQVSPYELSYVPKQQSFISRDGALNINDLRVPISHT